ncbi:uncharacterized protein LODBEIA_P50360 [Lodderomyces beijingensis]|uniref:Uncharacterized protein n=1 Tax=Lodderomyces beijingensis TaxID=1775926 RepID=A0ABP0ZRR5_9ASCO
MDVAEKLSNSPIDAMTSGPSRQFETAAVANDFPPSDARFDRSKLSDSEYISQLLFENKELQSLVQSQKKIIDKLQHQFDTLAASPRRKNLMPSQRVPKPSDGNAPHVPLQPSKSPPSPPLHATGSPAGDIITRISTPKTSYSPTREEEIPSPTQQLQRLELEQKQSRNTLSSSSLAQSAILQETTEALPVHEIPVRSSRRHQDASDPSNDGRSSWISSASATTTSNVPASATATAPAQLVTSKSNSSNLSSHNNNPFSPSIAREKADKTDSEQTEKIPKQAETSFDSLSSSSNTNTNTNTTSTRDINIISDLLKPPAIENTLTTVESIDSAKEESIDHHFNRTLESLKLRSDISISANLNGYLTSKSTSNLGATYKSSRIKPPSLQQKLSHGNGSMTDLAPPTSLKLALGERNGSKSAVTTPQTQSASNFGTATPNKDLPMTPDDLNDPKFDQFESPRSKFEEESFYQSGPPPFLPQSQSQSLPSTQATQGTQANEDVNGGDLQRTISSTSSRRLAPAYEAQRQHSNSSRSHQTPVRHVSVTSPSASGTSFSVLSTPKMDMDESSLFIKPDEFHTIFIKVVSTIHINTVTHQAASVRKIDDPNLTITINDRETNKEMWKIRKTHSQLCEFDGEIRALVEYFGLANLPDRTSFFSTVPSKIENRRSILQNYFNSIFLMPHIPQIVLYKICQFLSLDFVNPLDDFKSGSRKEGYLVRRYKGLGNSWKVRWCQIENHNLEIYPYPGGPMQEAIPLVNAQIGRQASDSVADDKGYRHAFLIMESQKSSKLHTTSSKHFFCAETDEERDDWVTALIEFTEPSPRSSETSPVNYNTSRDGSTSLEDKKFSYDSYSNGNDASTVFSSAYGGSSNGNNLDQVSSQTVISVDDSTKKVRKRSIFPFKNRSFSVADDPYPPSTPGAAAAAAAGVPPPSAAALASLAAVPPSHIQNGPSSGGLQSQDTTNSMQQYLDNMNLGDEVTKSIFRREVEVAYELSNHDFMGRQIPSICFRCLDYLNKTGAVFEEGIFRLSGSASTIRQLKEAFNSQYDIDLFKSPLKPDIHTVAGLFKMYLRELPSPILGSEAYNNLNSIILKHSTSVPPSQIALMFKEYINNPNKMDRIHYDLCYVIFKFLRLIISQNQINRMNLRNLCIVFVPTLNLSSEVLSTILIDFECIFENGKPISDANREVLDLNIPKF